MFFVSHRSFVFLISLRERGLENHFLSLTTGHISDMDDLSEVCLRCSIPLLIDGRDDPSQIGFRAESGCLFAIHLLLTGSMLAVPSHISVYLLRGQW